MSISAYPPSPKISILYDTLIKVVFPTSTFLLSTFPIKTKNRRAFPNCVLKLSYYVLYTFSYYILTFKLVELTNFYFIINVTPCLCSQCRNLFSRLYSLTSIYSNLLCFILYTCNNNTSDDIFLVLDIFKNNLNLTLVISREYKLLSIGIDAVKLSFMVMGKCCWCEVSEVSAAQFDHDILHSTIYLQVAFFIPMIATSLRSYKGNIFFK